MSESYRAGITFGTHKLRRPDRPWRFGLSRHIPHIPSDFPSCEACLDWLELRQLHRGGRAAPGCRNLQHRVQVQFLAVRLLKSVTRYYLLVKRYLRVSYPQTLILFPYFSRVLLPARAIMSSTPRHFDWQLFWLREVILVGVPTLGTVFASGGAMVPHRRIAFVGLLIVGLTVLNVMASGSGSMLIDRLEIRSPLGVQNVLNILLSPLQRRQSDRTNRRDSRSYSS